LYIEHDFINVINPDGEKNQNKLVVW